MSKIFNSHLNMFKDCYRVALCILIALLENQTKNLISFGSRFFKLEAKFQTHSITDLRTKLLPKLTSYTDIYWASDLGRSLTVSPNGWILYYA
ncbi:hypothetical protein NPIL_502291 [Nephila pilipes]|uniref:Uncharacterized protein n=1 Tax=Nephila pilipes TaxID=299642 RepID=A0A8X6Q9X6_NEPPI|nr:hypothetical protein NPIL_502291 [Nephila pilipes]